MMMVKKEALPDDAGFFVLPRRYAMGVLWTLAVLIATSASGIALVYNRIGNLERNDTLVEQKLLSTATQTDARFKKVDDLGDRTVRIEEQVKSVQRTLERIEGKLFQ